MELNRLWETIFSKYISFIKFSHFKLTKWYWIWQLTRNQKVDLFPLWGSKLQVSDGSVRGTIFHPPVIYRWQRLTSLHRCTRRWRSVEKKCFVPYDGLRHVINVTNIVHTYSRWETCAALLHSTGFIYCRIYVKIIYRFYTVCLYFCGI